MRGYSGDTVERIRGSKIEIQKYPEVITLPGRSVTAFVNILPVLLLLTRHR